MFNVITGLVMLVGNIGAGWLWESYGSSATFLAGAILSAVALLSLALLPGIAARKTG